jgi:hypothetical protein
MITAVNINTYKREYLNSIDSILDKKNWQNNNDVKQLVKYGFITAKQLELASLMFEVAGNIYEDHLWSIGLECITSNCRIINSVFKPNNFNDSRRLHVYCFTVLIKIPFVMLTNSAKHKLPIRDMYIRIYINDNRNVLELKGTRGVVSYEEYMDSYQHSHLPSNQYLGQFNNFCMGNGDYSSANYRINACINLFHRDSPLSDLEVKQKNDVKINIKMLMFSLKEMLSWESLEGGPHKKIADIFHKNENNGLINDRIIFKAVCNDFINRWWKEQSKNIDNGIKGINIPFKINKGEFEVVTSGLESVLLYYLERNRYLPHNSNTNIYCKLIAKKDSAGKYYAISSNLDNIIKKVPYAVQSTPFWFNNELITPYVDVNAKEIINELYVNPNFTKYVKRKIEQNIRKKRIKNDVINKLKTTSNLETRV